MLGAIPAIRRQVNRIPENWLTGCLLAIALALILVAIFVEEKEIKAGAVAWILIP